MTDLTRKIAAEWMARDPLFLDTETTGLDGTAEICDLAILDAAGRPVMSTLVRPKTSIPAAASAVHHITDDMVRDAPTFGELWPEVRRILSGRTVVIYNADYDARMLWQSLGTLPRFEPAGPSYQCAMLLYAEHRGEWNDYHGNYRWHRLGDAARHCRLPIPADLHRAAADAELARLLVMHMAGCTCRHIEDKDSNFWITDGCPVHGNGGAR